MHGRGREIREVTNERYSNRYVLRACRQFLHVQAEPVLHQPHVCDVDDAGGVGL